MASRQSADRREIIRKSVRRHYWDNDDNCAVTTIQTAAELFGIAIQQQVLDAALGLHGAGGYRAQCGLVEGGLMLIGILGRRFESRRTEIAGLCRRYAQEFESRFGSLLCRDLRPGGFRSDDPPHLCEDLSRRSIEFTLGFLSDRWNQLR
jgi:hypothetical protein